jgi:multidrug resistance efflux pump
LDRLDVRAPVRGIIVKLNHHAQGAVVAPGSVIFELLPVNDKLIIEARVKPNDITHLKEDQEALMRLTAFNQRMTPSSTAASNMSRPTRSPSTRHRGA